MDFKLGDTVSFKEEKEKYFISDWEDDIYYMSYVLEWDITYNYNCKSFHHMLKCVRSLLIEKKYV